MPGSQVLPPESTYHALALADHGSKRSEITTRGKDLVVRTPLVRVDVKDGVERGYDLLGRYGWRCADERDEEIPDDLVLLHGETFCHGQGR